MLAIVGSSARGAGRPTSKELKERAYAAFESGNYTTAITGYRDAYAVDRDARHLYNLALSYFKRYELRRSVIDLRQARDLFARFRYLTKATVYADRRQQDALRAARRFAKEYLAQIETKLAAPARAPDWPSGGRGTSTSKPTASRPVARPAAEQAPKVTKRPAARGEVPPRTRPVVSTPKRQPRFAHWVLYGIAAVAGISAAVTGGMALAADSEAADLAATGDTAGADDATAKAKRFAGATDVVIAVGVASAVAGVVYQLLVHRASVRPHRRRAAAGLVVKF